MAFTKEQVAALEAPLLRANVKTRSQSGRNLSYIEGWQAIAEANRIFGFDGWTRETIDLKMVAEKERHLGKAPNTYPGWGVTYIARVRITVGTIIREGCGTGHGIDRDLGQAHESALKEAETDAMKRALMTFGNPFGLALYDKTQANVADFLPDEGAPSGEAQEVWSVMIPNRDEPYDVCASAAQWVDSFSAMVDRVKMSPKYSVEEKAEKLRLLHDANLATFAKMPDNLKYMAENP